MMRKLGLLLRPNRDYLELLVLPVPAVPMDPLDLPAHKGISEMTVQQALQVQTLQCRVPLVQRVLKEPQALQAHKVTQGLKGPLAQPVQREPQVLQVRAQQVPRVHRAQQAQTALRAV